MCDIYQYVCETVSPVETVRGLEKRYYTTAEAAARYGEEAVVHEPHRGFYNTASVSAIETGLKGHDAQATSSVSYETGGLGEDAKRTAQVLARARRLGAHPDFSSKGPRC